MRIRHLKSIYNNVNAEKGICFGRCLFLHRPVQGKYAAEEVHGSRGE